MTKLFKIIRKFLGTQYLRILSVGASVIAFLINPLPVFMRARIKEKIKIIGKLDYSRREIKMLVDNHRQVQRLYACAKEPETVDWIEKFVQPGDVFYDVGANVGAYSFVAWAVSEGKSKVYSFEPSSSNFAALSQNIMLNKCSDAISSFNVALFDETKLLFLNYSSIEAGAAMHSLEKDVVMHKQENQMQTILGYKLDNFIDQFGLLMPNHIKIDVDGTEQMVLGGAHHVLSYAGLKSILIEIDNFEDNLEKVHRFLTEHGLEKKLQFIRGGGSGSMFNCIYQKSNKLVSCAQCNQ